MICLTCGARAFVTATATPGEQVWRCLSCKTWGTISERREPRGGRVAKTMMPGMPKKMPKGMPKSPSKPKGGKSGARY